MNLGISQIRSRHLPARRFSASSPPRIHGSMWRFADLSFSKCDEAQPSCRNCSKSKRQCLGYDPVFKPQVPALSVQSVSTQHLPPSSAAGLPLLSSGTYPRPGSPGKTSSHTKSPPPSSSSQMEYSGSTSGGPVMCPTFDAQGPAEDAHAEEQNAESRVQSVPPIPHTSTRRGTTSVNQLEKDILLTSKLDP